MYKLSTLFGNTTWGVKNTFNFNLDKDEDGGAVITDTITTNTSETTATITDKFVTSRTNWTDTVEFGMKLPNRIAVKAQVAVGHEANGTFKDKVVTAYTQDNITGVLTQETETTSTGVTPDSRSTPAFQDRSSLI